MRNAGVQGVKNMEGELWGISNLLKLTADRLETHNIIQAQRQDEQEYRIERCDMNQLGVSSQPPPPPTHLFTRTSTHAHARTRA